MSHKHNQEKFVSLLLEAVTARNIQESEQEIKASVIQKIKAELELSKSRFLKTVDTVRAPSMGMITISHEVSEEPRSLFATDVRSYSVVVVRIYEASQSIETKKINKESLLAEFFMSETQFGEMMLNPNHGEGYPATLNAYDNCTVKPYDEKKDYSKFQMASLIDDVKSPSVQIERFMNEMTENLESAKASGRLGKEKVEDIHKHLGLLVSHTASAGVHNIEKVNKLLTKRVAESSLNIHLTTNELLSDNSNKFLESKVNSDHKDMMVRLTEKLSEEEYLLLAQSVTEMLNEIASDLYSFSADIKDFDINGEKRQCFVMGSFMQMTEINLKRISERSNGAINEQVFKRLNSVAMFNPSQKSEFDEDAHILVSALHTSGFGGLFDHPEEDSRALVLNLKRAGFDDSLIKDRHRKSFSPSARSEFLEVALSPEQYVRAMRSGDVEVACTILKSHGETNDMPPRDINGFTQAKTELKKNMLDSMTDIESDIEAIREFFSNGSISGKKKIADLHDKVTSVIERIRALNETHVEMKGEALKEVAIHHANAVENIIEFELQKLPKFMQDKSKEQLKALYQTLK